MAILTSGFTFNPSAREIVFSGVSGFDVAYLQKIINKTTNQTIYDESDPTLGFLFYEGAQCFFAAGMNIMNAGDELAVTYTDNSGSVSQLPTLADNLVGAGTVQSAAMALTTNHCVITSAPAGNNAFCLPATGALGSVDVRNKDTVHAAIVYPPIGGAIDGYGTNQPIAIPPGSGVLFIPGSAPGQWWS